MHKIIMNERKYLEEIKEKGCLGKNIGYALSLFAVAYRSEGYSPKEIKEKLLCDLVKYEPSLSAEYQKRYVLKAIKSKKKQFVQIDEILITKLEMETIMSITSDTAAFKETSLQRLAFSLLCFAKFEMAKNKNNKPWVNYELNRIYKAAKLKGRSLTQNNLYLHKLGDRGMVQLVPHKDNVGVKVNFVDENKNSEIALRIKDINYAGDYFFQYCGRKYIECKSCGMLVPKVHGKLLYCKDCAKIVHSEQTRAKVARWRTNNSKNVT